jgi:hypothetical protein
VILALAGLLAVVVGTAFGGRVGRLADLRFRGTSLIVVALAAQVAAYPSGALPWHTGDAVATFLWVGSYALLIAATFANGHIHGIGFVALGMACNLAAILTNGGHMPALPHAAAATGVEGVHANSAALAHPHLALLVDRWVAPGWVPMANVFSIGDVILFAAGFAVVLIAMGPRLPRRARRGHAIASSST